MGMHQLRNARKQPLLQDGPSTKSIRTIVGGAHGGTVHTPGGKDLKVERNSDEYVFKHNYPVTKPPLSDEHPSRGEGPERNVKSKKGK